MMLEIVYLQQTYIFIWTNNRVKIDVEFFRDLHISLKGKLSLAFLIKDIMLSTSRKEGEVYLFYKG